MSKFEVNDEQIKIKGKIVSLKLCRFAGWLKEKFWDNKYKVTGWIFENREANVSENIRIIEKINIKRYWYSSDSF